PVILPNASLEVQALSRIGRDRRRRTREADVTTTLYGIRNCDTMKKAWTWLDQHGVAYAFHDYRKEGISRARLDAWVGRLGWELLLSRGATTCGRVPEGDRGGLAGDRAVGLMRAQPSMIKRPVLEAKGRLLVGFKPADYEQLFG